MEDEIEDMEEDNLDEEEDGDDVDDEDEGDDKHEDGDGNDGGCAAGTEGYLKTWLHWKENWQTKEANKLLRHANTGDGKPWMAKLTEWIHIPLQQETHARALSGPEGSTSMIWHDDLAVPKSHENLCDD